MRPSVLADAWEGLRRNKSVAVSVILVTMISMYLFGVGLLAQQQVEQMKAHWYDRVQVSVHLCTENSEQPNCAAGAATAEQKASVAAQLEELRPLVEDVHDESEQEARYRVRLSDPEEFETVASAVERAPGVARVPDLSDDVSPVFKAIDIVTGVMVGLALLSLVSAVLLMATTIRQAAFTRRREIMIMKLVGATNRTIRTPFIIETVVAGLVGALIAVGLLWLSVWVLFDRYLLQHHGGTAYISSTAVWGIAPFLVLGVVVLAVVVSTVTLRRYLRV